MNYDYQTVKRIFKEREITVDESYIKKALNELGFSEFPKSGLEDNGLTRLISTATDISHREANLIPKKISKIEQTTSLESRIRKEEIEEAKDILGFIGKGITKFCISSFTNLAFRIPFALPTYIRKNRDKNEKREISWELGDSIFTGIVGGFIENFFVFASLYETSNQKIIPPLILTQLITNTTSLVYEWKRHTKRKARCLSCVEDSNYSPCSNENLESNQEPRCEYYQSYSNCGRL